ncbi:MAG: cytochrome b [Rickettsiaceae bacterium]|nr:cytochrome b [Rickettsiaceae bacterium]
MIKNTANSYGLISRLFHWIMSFWIIIMICAGYYMTSLPNSSDKFAIYGIHKQFGVLFFIFVVLRIIWRLRNISPSPLEGTPYWQSAGASLNFKVLYLLMILMPFTGVAMSLYGGYPINFFGIVISGVEKNLRLSELANQMHKAFVVLLLISISLHIIGGMYHHFVRKDRTLMRMIRG